MLVYQQLRLVFGVAKLDTQYTFVNYIRNLFPFNEKCHFLVGNFYIR